MRRRITLRTRRAISGYLFILPFIIGFLTFMVRPLIDSLYMSFCTVTVSVKGFAYEFIGLTNYSFSFTGDPEFTRLLTEEIAKTAINSVATLVVSFVVAVLLNQRFKGRTFVRAIFFLPVILASGVLVGLETDNSLMASINAAVRDVSPVNIGSALEDILITSGLGIGVLNVLFNLMNSIYNIVIASGIQIVVFLAGLQTISPSMYEAADVEGCTKWESFWKITFPMISPLLLVNCIYTIVDFFVKSDNTVMEKIGDEMLGNYNFGFSAAMSWIYFAIIIVMIALCSAIISKGVHYYE